MSKRIMKPESANYIFYCYIALLVWAPLPLGSNRAWAWSILEIGAFALLGLWIVSYLIRPYKTPPALKEAQVPLILLCLWLCYVLFQAMPLSSGTLQSISPEAYRLYITADPSPKYVSISVDRHATFEMLLKACAYTAIVFLTFMLVTSAKRLSLLVKALVLVGLFESFYGLFNTLTGIEHIWWREKTDYIGVVTGTFINRNHFAGLMELTIPLGLALIMSRKSDDWDLSDIKATIRAFISFLLGKNGLYTFFLIVMFGAFFLSASRAGITFFFIALAISAFFSTIFNKGQNRQSGVIYLVLLLTILATVWLGLGKLPDRAGELKWNIGDRVATWKSTIEMSKDYQVFGSGAGTYEHLLTRYEDRSGPGDVYKYYDHAHNDYLEILSEQGIIGFSLATMVTLLLFIKMTIGYATRKNPYFNAILFGSFTGCVSLLLHALVDFNFQIPSNAVYFYVVLSIGVIASTIKGEKRGQQ